MEVIENKILLSLEKSDSVAVILSQRDLETLIAALQLSKDILADINKANEMLEGLKELHKAAFPSNKKQH